MPSPSNYREFAPGPSLAGLVECFWSSTVREAPQTSSSHRILPDGCIDLLFDFMAGRNQRATLVGTMSRPLTFTTTGPVDLLGVRFRPGGLSSIFDLNAAELTDARVDLANFWGKGAQEAWHCLGEATPARRIQLMREMLGDRVKTQSQADPFIHYCITRIEAASGNLRISDLERGTGISARQLERKFAWQLGITPKTFARIVRFKGVVAASSLDKPDWARLAVDFGFSDQPHLVREFKALSGLTPEEFLDTTNDRP